MHDHLLARILSGIRHFERYRTTPYSRTSIHALLLVTFLGASACSDHDDDDHRATGGAPSAAGASSNTRIAAGSKSTVDSCPAKGSSGTPAADTCGGMGGSASSTVHAAAGFGGIASTSAAGATSVLGTGGSAIADSGIAGVAASAGSNGTATEPDPELPYFAPDHVVDVKIDLDVGSWDTLRAEERSLTDIIVGDDCLSSPFESPYTWKRATITVDGVTRSNVGLRKKGFLGSLDRERPSLKVAFDQFEPQDLFGVRDLTLNNVIQDPAVISQCLGYAVFAKAGLSAPRCNFAHIAVNGQNLGVYAHVEPVKKPFLRRHFGSDAGDLYEGTISDFRDDWLGTFDPKTTEKDTGKAALQAVARTVKAPPEQLTGALREVIDLEAFASFWATEVLIAHLDGYSRNINNFYVYRLPSTGRVTFLPWGADMLFGNNDATAKTDDPMGKYTQGVVANALYTTVEGRSLLLTALRSVLDRAWNESDLLIEAQRMAELIRPQLGPTQVNAFDVGLRGLREFVTSRRVALLKAIANPPANAQPLRPYACLLPIGNISGTFSTTWQPSEPKDPFTTGTGSLEVVLNGTPWGSVPGQVGAFAAPNQEPSAEQDAQLVIPTVLTNGKVGIVAFGFNQVDAVPGTMKLDLIRTPAMLLELDLATSHSEALGVAMGGSLVFDSVGTTSGGPVIGHFSSEVYYTPFLNGF